MVQVREDGGPSAEWEGPLSRLHCPFVIGAGSYDRRWFEDGRLMMGERNVERYKERWTVDQVADDVVLTSGPRTARDQRAGQGQDRPIVFERTSEADVSYRIKRRRGRTVLRTWGRRRVLTADSTFVNVAIFVWTLDFGAPPRESVTNAVASMFQNPVGPPTVLSQLTLQLRPVNCLRLCIGSRPFWHLLLEVPQKKKKTEMLLIIIKCLIKF